MKISTIESIEPRLQKIENRENSLTEREVALNLPLAEQNERFEKLRKGYVSLKLIEDNFEYEFQPITRDTYDLMLKILNNKYNIETIKFENINERDKLEQYFSELIPLIQTRWSSICGYKRLWKSRRMEYRQEINTILDTEMKKLAESTDAVDQTK